MERRGRKMRAAIATAARTAFFFVVPAAIAAMPIVASTPHLLPFAVLDALGLTISARLAAQAGIRSMVRAAGSAALVFACVVFVLGSVLPRLGLYRPVTVYSNSMRPTFRAGDMIIVTPEPTGRVRKGDVITYAIPIGDRHTESHRVVRVLEGGRHPVVVTKGDANHDADPWNAKLNGAYVWHYRGRLPDLGYVVIALRMPFVRVLCLVMFPLLLASIALARVWGYRVVRISSPGRATTA